MAVQVRVLTFRERGVTILAKLLASTVVLMSIASLALTVHSVVSLFG